ncbi:MAG: hypothetical protein K0U98_12600 [Deltaproteobacteria bacterium]|nr:hypothetical protein [Deltaproteobacteria bacterium]
MDQRKFSEALESLAEALELAKVTQGQQLDLQATILIQKYLVLTYSSNEIEAFQTLEEAERLLEPAGPSRLASIVLQNQLDYLSRTGDYPEAQRLLPRLEEMTADLGLEPDPVKLTWTRARIAQGTGAPETSIRLFQEAQQSFLEANQGYRAALVSLELATVLFEQGQLQEVQQLAAQMLSVFRAQEIDREALAALALFEQAAATKQLTERLVRDLVDYFHRAQGNPKLPFDPS